MHADVAVSLTSLATIVLRARWRGVLGRRGFVVESITARICREAGGRVSTNVLVRDLDLPVPVNDARRLEVVVDGFTTVWRRSTGGGLDFSLGIALRWECPERGR